MNYTAISVLEGNPLIEDADLVW